MGYLCQTSGGPRADVSAPLWRALRDQAEPSTVEQLHKLLGAKPETILQRLGRWRAVGWVEKLPHQGQTYRIAPKSAGLKSAPTVGSMSRDVWAALRRLGTATLPQILEASGADDRPLYCRLRRWQRRGHLIKTPYIPCRFRLTEDAPRVSEPPKVTIDCRIVPRRTSRDRQWSAMRVLKTFDLPLLQITAEANNRQCTEFVAALVRAGYVRKVGQPSIPSGAAATGMVKGHSVYRLIRNTGRLAPRLNYAPSSGDGPTLIDRNTGERIAMPARQPRRSRAEMAAANG